MDHRDIFSSGLNVMDKESIDALCKQVRFYTETMTILSNEGNERLNKLAALLKNTEAIEVVNDVAVQIIPFNNDEVMKAVQDFDTFIMVTSEVTDELEQILKQNATNNKTGFIFSYKEVDENVEATNGEYILYRINHGISTYDDFEDEFPHLFGRST
uniref:Uncharacterized protein n=1 Tax=Panagrolaimus davidi TaxID=227884 RepID=A0A914R7H5_9BILA